jgi:pentatricopeptide repeat domain-containing protein 1
MESLARAAYHEELKMTSLACSAGRRGPKNPRSATMLPSGLARERLPNIAFQVLNCMQAGHVEANVFHYNAVIKTCEKTGQWLPALSLSSSMPCVKIAPDKISYNVAISACEKAAQWQLALSVLSSMPDMNVTTNEISYNAAISSCSKGGQWKLTLLLLSSMPNMKCAPNQISYNAAISACEKGRQWQLGLALVSTMPDMKVTPNPRLPASFAICTASKML